MPDPALSVVIPTYNRAGMLRRSLETLLQQTLPPHLYEVIVVDDGSTDETPEVVRALGADGRVRLVRQAVNRGRSAARNAGVRVARGEIIVFLDSDVLVRPDFLAQHLDVHKAAGAPVVGRGPVIPVADAHLPQRVPVAQSSAAYLDTANASLPRGELLAAGLFDEGFRVYGWEDIDLGFRLQRRGLRRVFRREAVVFHVQPVPSPETFDEAVAKERERAGTAVYLYRKHPGWRTRLLIQFTPLHTMLYFLMAGGGLLHARNAPAIAARLRRRGQSGLEYLVLRSVLNRVYLAALREEWQKATAEHDR